ncbi:MAG: 5-nitroimidazole antibiotic resistance protein [Clostridiales bacterium GWF2_38_85]|nr:MAG: 5-nitroimidazole antibiotic resistance protein [Clostridiales bacterium GWF2_38_85]HBL83765.1 5-nitroimidazole antibiotic resistance protein [Clostridiales bacterium]
MRRSDREIKNFNDIVDVLSRCDTIRLGINRNDYPYVIPLSFGFEVENGKVNIYFHGAKEGLKHELLVNNNRVCVEADICHRFVDTGHNVTAEYESVIGFGKAVKVFDYEAANGLDLLLKHCGFENYQYNKSVKDLITVYKITLNGITGKRRTV